MTLKQASRVGQAGESPTGFLNLVQWGPHPEWSSNPYRKQMPAMGLLL